jgi:hypothetical protein
LREGGQGYGETPKLEERRRAPSVEQVVCRGAEAAARTEGTVFAADFFVPLTLQV